MARVRFRSFATPDEVRRFPLGTAGIVGFNEVTGTLIEVEPGWRWSTHIRDIMRTDTCQVHHVGYTLSGRMGVLTDEGEEAEIPPNSLYEIGPGHDAWVVGEEPWRTIEWTSGRILAVPPEGPARRILVTVLMTDLVGSTATLERVGDAAWRDLLLTHNARLRDQLNLFRGREVTTTGDGMIAVFDSASRAVGCAAAMARAARDLGLSLRAGVHTGEVEFVGADAQGLAVHAAARIMSLGSADEVLVSATTRDLLEGSGLELEDAGTFEMKGLTGARRVYRLNGG